jgi:hypothetical protein
MISKINSSASERSYKLINSSIVTDRSQKVFKSDKTFIRKMPTPTLKVGKLVSSPNRI